MSTVQPTIEESSVAFADATLAALPDRLEVMNHQIARMERERDAYLHRVAQVLTDFGFESRVVRAKKDIKVGDVGLFSIIWEQWHHRPTVEAQLHTRVLRKFADDTTISVQRIADDYIMVFENRGAWQVRAIDAPSGQMVISKVNVVDLASDIRRSVSRLRTFARHDDLRVRFRDTEVKLIDPLDNPVYEGSILGAFLFLANIDPVRAVAK